MHIQAISWCSLRLSLPPVGSGRYAFMVPEFGIPKDMTNHGVCHHEIWIRGDGDSDEEDKRKRPDSSDAQIINCPSLRTALEKSGKYCPVMNALKFCLNPWSRRCMSGQAFKQNLAVLMLMAPTGVGIAAADAATLSHRTKKRTRYKLVVVGDVGQDIPDVQFSTTKIDCPTDWWIEFPAKSEIDLLLLRLSLRGYGSFLLEETVFKYITTI
ncbi:hypothetical protein B0H11DRAFT_1933105 [Mycena galericulata]|nr:hypothetical protein B0H11DRAFT_1933105 [Mycena galericulata]